MAGVVSTGHWSVKSGGGCERTLVASTTMHGLLWLTYECRPQVDECNCIPPVYLVVQALSVLYMSVPEAFCIVLPTLLRQC